MATSDTARSLLHFFGTLAEWGESYQLNVHRVTPELMALVMALLDAVPAAWIPYSSDRDDGFVRIHAPEHDAAMVSAGCWSISLAVHCVPRPPRWTRMDPASAESIMVERATVAALLGLASLGSEDLEVHRVDEGAPPAAPLDPAD